MLRQKKYKGEESCGASGRKKQGIGWQGRQGRGGGRGTSEDLYERDQFWLKGWRTEGERKEE